MRTTLSILMLALFMAFNTGYSQETAKKADSGYVFTIVKQVPATPVKNQYRSGTCWSFSTVGFVEAELLRTKHDTFNLSDMYCVRQAYSDKAEMYVRFNGKHNFGGGGEAHDVMNVLRNYGMIPAEAYSGNVIGEDKPVHGEMDAVLDAMINVI